MTRTEFAQRALAHLEELTAYARRGLILTWQTLQFELDLSASYSLRTEANDFDAGDEARGEASFQYRVVPWGDLGDGVPTFVYAVPGSSRGAPSLAHRRAADVGAEEEAEELADEPAGTAAQELADDEY